jgi:hypothetical protein
MREEDTKDRLDTIEENCLNINEKRKEKKETLDKKKKDKYSVIEW